MIKRETDSSGGVLHDLQAFCTYSYIKIIYHYTINQNTFQNSGGCVDENKKEIYWNAVVHDAVSHRNPNYGAILIVPISGKSKTREFVAGEQYRPRIWDTNPAKWIHQCPGGSHLEHPY